MYHPFDSGQYWQESHHPQVKILKKAKKVEITLFVSPALHEEFQTVRNEHWIYQWREGGEKNIAYLFTYFLPREHLDTVEIQALNTLLSFCANGGSQIAVTENPREAQLAFIAPENPVMFEMGAFGLWANFSAPITEFLHLCSQLEALEEYIGSRMRGAHKIIAPDMKISRPENRVNFYRGGNPFPIFTTFGNCACLSATHNAAAYGGGFDLSPHNIDSYSQQFLILVGTLIFWQRMRVLLHQAP